jgi:hypothetical protein
VHGKVQRTKQGGLTMAFEGFKIESKKYMGYEDRTFKEKIDFWIRYPRAYLKFIKKEMSQ